jgi:hypothetical protein
MNKFILLSFLTLYSSLSFSQTNLYNSQGFSGYLNRLSEFYMEEVSFLEIEIQ